MKNQKFYSNAFAVLCLGSSLFISSCKDATERPPVTPVTPVAEEGVYIINEGSAKSAVSYYNKTTKQVTIDRFEQVNKRPVGQYLQSMAVHNGKAYLLAGGSDKIEVVNAESFLSVGVINGLKAPRYMVVSGNKGYVTEAVNFTSPGRVSVIDLNTNTVLKTIPVGISPELLLIANNKLFVTNSGNDFVSVINLATETVETSITVGTAPNSLVLDAQNKLWVLCGMAYVSGGGKLVSINPANNAIEKTFTMTSGATTPQDLIINGAKDRLYYTFDAKVFRMPTNATALLATPLINRDFYGLGVDPKENIIYAAESKSFSSNGKVIRYNQSGVALDSFAVSIAPNGFYFK